MIALEAAAALLPDLETSEVITWIELRWVQPELAADNGWIFHPVDVARLRLVYDLRRTFETPPDTMPLVLSLLDQVYELRRNLKAVTRALDDQPDEIRAAVLRAIGGKEPR